MTKIVFFEDKHFQGRRYECDSNRSNFSTFLSRCNSIRVESGTWVVYELPNYKGKHYLLTRGEYPDYHGWNGLNDHLSSCKIISTTSKMEFVVQLYDRTGIAGKAIESSEDCPSVQERFPL